MNTNQLIQQENNMENKTLLDKIIAPDREQQRKHREAIKNVMYYFLIGVISLIAAVVVPFFAGGITGDFALYFPKSTIGWIVYWLIRGGSALLNVCVFALFKMQALVNVKNEPGYIEAKTILNKLGPMKERKPRSPGQMNAQEWSGKGITIFFSSLLAGCTLSALVLVFDLVTFLSCIVTVIMGIVFGYVTMRKNEIYWTEEYLEYANMLAERQKALESQKAKEERENAKLRKQGIQKPSRTSAKKRK